MYRTCALRTTNQWWKKSKRMERHITFTDHKTQMVKMSILPKLTHRFNKILIKISVGLFADMGTIILKCIEKKPKKWKYIILKRKNKIWGASLHINCVLLVQRKTNTSMEQNRKPKNKPHKYAQLIFDKRIKAIQWKQIFLPRGPKQLDIH